MLCINELQKVIGRGGRWKNNLMNNRFLVSLMLRTLSWDFDLYYRPIKQYEGATYQLYKNLEGLTLTVVNMCFIKNMR